MHIKPCQTACTQCRAVAFSFRWTRTVTPAHIQPFEGSAGVRKPQAYLVTVV